MASLHSLDNEETRPTDPPNVVLLFPMLILPTQLETHVLLVPTELGRSQSFINSCPMRLGIYFLYIAIKMGTRLISLRLLPLEWCKSPQVTLTCPPVVVPPSC